QRGANRPDGSAIVGGEEAASPELPGPARVGQKQLADGYVAEFEGHRRPGHVQPPDPIHLLAGDRPGGGGVGLEVRDPATEGEGVALPQHFDVAQLESGVTGDGYRFVDPVELPVGEYIGAYERGASSKMRRPGVDGVVQELTPGSEQRLEVAEIRREFGEADVFGHPHRGDGVVLTPELPVVRFEDLHP